jgi:hypothetical protein
MEKKPMTVNEILLANLPPKIEQPPVEQTSTTETPINDAVKVEEPKTVTPEAPTTEVTLDDWDNDAPKAAEPSVPAEIKFDFSSFVKDLGIEAKDPTELKEKLKSSKPAEDVLSGVDERLKKAIEFSKKGGDYLALLGVSKIDYSAISPTALYENAITNDPNYTQEEARELLDSLSPLQKKERGLQLRNEYERAQKAQLFQFEESIKAIEQSKAERKAKADKELKSTLDKVEKIAGLTVKPHHKADIYDAITSGRMQQELFFDQKTGDYDYQSMIETYYVKKNLPKILEHLKKMTSSDTLRGFVKEVSNVSLDKSKEAPAPVVEKTPDPIMSAVERSRKGGRV